MPDKLNDIQSIYISFNREKSFFSHSAVIVVLSRRRTIFYIELNLHNQNFSSSFFFGICVWECESACVWVWYMFAFYLLVVFETKKSLFFFTVAVGAAAIMVLFVHYTISTIILCYQYQSGVFLSHSIHFSVQFVVIPFFVHLVLLYFRFDWNFIRVMWVSKKNQRKKAEWNDYCHILLDKKRYIVFRIHYFS